MMRRNVPAHVREVQELRRSNAATPVPSGKRYSRKDRVAWRREYEHDDSCLCLRCYDLTLHEDSAIVLPVGQGMPDDNHHPLSVKLTD